MIAGIGIDTVEIVRFKQWEAYSDKKLLRVFTPHEIHYCKANARKSAERFAVRFAAKEAFFKAFSHAYPHHRVPFLTVCKFLEIQAAPSGAPCLHVLCDSLEKPPLKAHLSLSHSAAQAVAVVILEKID